MKRYYKLTDSSGKSRGGMDWFPGKTNRATGEGTRLCTDGVLHAYESPLMAVFLAPAHVSYFTNSRMFAVEGVEVANDGTKVGFKELLVLEEIPVPEVTPTARVAFAILAVRKVFGGSGFARWSERWLSGEDRSVVAAQMFSRSPSPTILKDSRGDSLIAVSWAAQAACDVATNNVFDGAMSSAYAVVKASPGDLKSLAEEAMRYA